MGGGSRPRVKRDCASLYDKSVGSVKGESRSRIHWFTLPISISSANFLFLPLVLLLLILILLLFFFGFVSTEDSAFAGFWRLFSLCHFEETIRSVNTHCDTIKIITQ